MNMLRRKTIPGLHSLNPLKAGLALRKEPLQFLSELQKRHGNIVQFNLAIWPTVFISHPDYIKHVLQDNYPNYDKDTLLFRMLRPLLGNGLMTVSGGDDWLRQRKLVQPAFHSQRIAALGTSMTDVTNMMLQQWDPYIHAKQAIDIEEEMDALTLQILGQALFNIDMSPKSSRFHQAFSFAKAFTMKSIYNPLSPLIFGKGRHRRLWSAMKTIDTVIYELIRTRRKQKEDVGDMLSMLLNTVDEDGRGMNDKQLRDEIMTLLAAGHETSANALTWTWYLLTQHPEAQERLHAELDQVLGERIPTTEDLPRLNYTRMVLEESMRLYPPGWILMRRAIQDDEIDGYPIPANSYIMWSSYIAHRHPDFWERPEQFYPEHFAQKYTVQRPPHAFMPFSNGPRTCLGNSFAMMEMQLILATIAQQYNVSLVPGHHVELQTTFLLRPKDGVPVMFEQRQRPKAAPHATTSCKLRAVRLEKPPLVPFDNTLRR
jgi:cytochrome P450